VQAGQQLLINGAGGGTGVFAVQLAKSAGAEVTGVDHTTKLDFMRSLGADHVVDYTREDFTRSGRQYDLVLDLIAHRPALAYRRALKPHGTYFAVGGSVATFLQILFLGPLVRRAAGKKIRILMVQPNREDLMAVAEQCAAGQLALAVDRVYPLEQVPEALAYLGAGQAKGKIVIRVD
jgi:NADPH:quinone reductase-like Zn-dependent oxidoreductase